jgi:Holliday junction resolvase RusA-like endonuclease
MNELAFLLRKECLNHKITKEEIIEKFIEWTYKIVFYFKIPKWKEKLIKLEDPHQSSPDIDNCFKWFTDTLFYHADRNDREIWTINAEKKYQAENSILLYIF